MDTAVSLVNAYLHINGFLTVTEYPLLETRGSGHSRTATDLDVLAFRFPHAGQDLRFAKGRSMSGDVRFAPDPALGGSPDSPDMIIGEVKRGSARFNPATFHPGALAAALMRFGCCSHGDAGELATELVKRGHAVTGHGHEVRMIAFGSIEPDQRPGGWRVISLAHVVEQLRAHLHSEWSRMRQLQFGNPVLDLLALQERIAVESNGQSERRPV